MPEQLTSTERKVYHFLLDFLAEHTYQPSIREIGRTFEIKSTKTVSEILQSLANKGYIERDASRSRGVRLKGFEVSRRTQPVPYYGKIAAGEPALLPENQQGSITMDRRFLPREDVFFLRIKGDSMIGRGIHDGDYILVLPTERADDGAIVAARLGDEATVKTITYRDGRVVLVPANPADREIEVAADANFSLLGTVCGVFRPFQEVE
ncbi:MAG TPA: transcriptional repressor LexA [Gemmatimonadaceae bacterium]